MARKPRTPNDSGTTIPRYDSFRDFEKRSPFWQRLKAFDRADVNQLRTTIQHVAEDAQATAKKIIACMPFYTLHDERHLLNLLGWIEVPTPPETLGHMPPLEVGLCILGVLVHDLGMAQPLDEQRAIASGDPQSADYEAFDRFAQGRFGEELRLAQRLEKRKQRRAKDRAQLIRQHILSEFLRSTHAPPTGDRIRRWALILEPARRHLRFHKGLKVCGNRDAHSHGKCLRDFPIL
jgi:hypothetical protein